MILSYKEQIFNKIKESKKAIDLTKFVSKIEDAEVKDKDLLMSRIFTDLMLDGRFVRVNNKWDLKENHTIEEINKHKSIELSGVMVEETEASIEDIISEEDVKVISTDDEDIEDQESLEDFLDADLLDD